MAIFYIFGFRQLSKTALFDWILLVLVVVVVVIVDVVLTLTRVIKSVLFFFFLFFTTLLSSFWTSRGCRCRPFSPPVLAFNFYRA